MSETKVQFTVDEISEDDAFSLVYALERKFGWAVLLYTRGDVESYLNAFSESEIALTDEDWSEITSSWTWRKFSDWAGVDGEIFSQLLDDPDIRNVLSKYEGEDE